MKRFRLLRTFVKQKFQETQKFHVGKGKCLRMSGEREMSVWSLEISANHLLHD